MATMRTTETIGTNQRSSYNKQSDTDSNLAKKVNDLARWVDDYRYRYGRQWYINWAFYENNHFVWWNNAQNIITPISPSPGQVMRMVPKARRQVEAIQNMILSSEVRWSVTPRGSKSPDEDANTALRVNQWLQDKWDDLDVEGKLDELVSYAMYYPYSIMYVGWDDDVNDLYLKTYDAFDVLLPPCTDIEEAPFIILTYWDQIDKIKANPLYINDNPHKDNLDFITPSPDRAFSFFKQNRLNQKLAQPASISQYNELTGAIVKEYWCKQYDKDGNISIRLIVVVGEQLIYEKTYPNISSYPFVMYKPFSGDIYQPAWIEKFIPLNKSLDVLVSQIENYTNVMVRGRYAIQKNQSITRMSNNDGEFIYTDSGQPPIQIPLEQLPSYLFTHIANLEKWIEEQGVSTVALGKVPKGVKAYKAIESLKQSDFSNLRVPVKNLENSLMRLTEKVLDVASRNILLPTKVYHMNSQNKPDYFNIIGEEGAKLDLNKDAMNPEQDTPTPDNPLPKKKHAPTVISNSYQVKAVIDNGLSYTQEGKQDSLMQLYNAKILDPETVLEGFKFGNISDILERTKGNRMTEQSFINTPDFQAAAQGKFGQEGQQSAISLLQQAQQPQSLVNNPLHLAEVQGKPSKGQK